ncbi:MAG TPA: PilZ domain-containing protein [Spirochaetota bacterium]|nr:PilZ domain-containing protein [Spirochaetota bacterium]
MGDKRKFAREKKELKSELHSEDGMIFSTARDISEGGLFISTPVPGKEGQEIDMRLYTPGKEPKNLKGKVRWIREDEDTENRAGMGIEFVDLSDDDKKEISKILHTS